VVAADAGNIISEISLAIETNTGLSAIAAVIHPYAAQHAVTALLSLLCCRCSKTWQLSLPLLSSFIFACSCHDFGAVSANAIMSLLHVQYSHICCQCCCTGLATGAGHCCRLYRCTLVQVILPFGWHAFRDYSSLVGLGTPPRQKPYGSAVISTIRLVCLH